MAHTATHNGWTYRIEIHNDRVFFELDATSGPGEVSAIVRRRTTNRKQYRSGVLEGTCSERLGAATPPIGGTAAHWITGGRQRAVLCDLLGRADAMAFSAKPIRNAFLATVRFDQPTNAVVNEGLSVGSLELSTVLRLALRAQRRIPDRVFRTMGGGKIFKWVTMRLARSASGFCLITTTASGPDADFMAGRIFERAWLAATGEQLAAQPAMTLPVLRTILDNGTDSQKDGIDRAASADLLREFAEFAATIADGSPSAILRFGTADEPTVRVGRLPARVSIDR